MYNNNEELLDDSLINSQIVALNEAFFLCSDTVRAIFKDSRGCPKMIFKLATFDPNGKRTNGILKKYTSNKTFYKNDSLFVLDHPKFAKFGGSNAWDPKRYINIWFCNLEQPSGKLIHGYAFPPSGAKNWPEEYNVATERQGIVLHYKILGKNNPNNDSHNNSGYKTLVHEMGHYFGLKHIWGDKTKDCNLDDGLDDTPRTNTPSYFCNFNKNTCSNSGSIDLPDMVENFMDYSNQACLKMFTREQTKVIRLNLFYHRTGLPQGCFIDTIKYLDQIFIFPNPVTKDFFYLQYLGETRQSDEVFFKIYNCTGMVILENVIAPLEPINLVKMPNVVSGTYFVQISFRNTLATYKLVIL